MEIGGCRGQKGFGPHSRELCLGLLLALLRVVPGGFGDGTRVHYMLGSCLRNVLAHTQRYSGTTPGSVLGVVEGGEKV